MTQVKTTVPGQAEPLTQATSRLLGHAEVYNPWVRHPPTGPVSWTGVGPSVGGGLIKLK